jgi:hypothetical protein
MIESLERDLKDGVEQQLIVCYSPWEWIRDLSRKDGQRFIEQMAKDDSLEDRLKSFARIPTRDIRTHKSKQVNKNNYEVAAGAESCIILHIPPGYRLPFRLYGFEQIHLCLSAFREQTIFDPYTEQMARVRLLTSQEDRLEQVSLAYRTDDEPIRITMYCDEGTIRDFVESGASE